MAKQIKKKFIADKAIDGEKLELLEGQSLKQQKSDGSTVDLMKLNAEEKIEVGGELSVSGNKISNVAAGEQDSDVVNKGQLDSAVQGVQTQIDNLDLDYATDQQLADAVSAEQTRAEGEEARIEGLVSDEATARQSADSTLQSNIDAEASARAAADSAEEAARIAADSAEASARAAADSALQSNIDDEATARQSADSTLQGNIDAEEAARIAADDALGVRIDNILSNTDPAALDSLSEVVDAFKDADGNLQTSITTLSTNASNDRAAIRSEFADAVSAEQTRAEGEEARIEGLVSDEATARQSADSTLQSNIDAEASARAAADSALQSNIDDEASARAAADSTLQDNIDAEASARQSADSALQSNIDDEETARIAADELMLKLDGSRAMQASLDMGSEVQQVFYPASDGYDNGTITVQDFYQMSGNNPVYLGAVQMHGGPGTHSYIIPNIENQMHTHVRLIKPNGDEFVYEIDLDGSIDLMPNGFLKLIGFDAEEFLGGTTYMPVDQTFGTTSDSFLSNKIVNVGDGSAPKDAVNKSQLDSVESALQYQITTNKNAIDVLNGDSSVEGSVAKAVADVIDMAPEALDTLNELAAAIGDDANFAASVTQQITDAKNELKGQVSEAFDTMEEIENEFQKINGDSSVEGSVANQISAEASARQSADSALQSNIDDEETARAAADSALQSNIDDEASARQSADSALQSNIDDEASARAAADSALQSNIDDEASARQSADTTLQSNIDAEASARQSADTTLQSNIDAEASARAAADSAEASARAAADSTLQSNIDDEATARAAADSTLQGNIDAEEAARIAADDALGVRIDNILSNTDPAALDSLSEVVDAFKDADDTINGAITQLSGQASADRALIRSEFATADSTLQSNIDDEATARQSADSTLQGNIDAEATARQSADSTLQGNIDAEASARAAADSTLQGNIDAEASARAAADSALQSNIDDEASARAAADSALQSNIDDEASARAAADSTEEAARIAADADLQSQLDVESLRARIAEEDLQSNIDAEASARQSADTTLQDNIDDEATARQSADSTLQGNIDAEASARAAADSALQSNIDDEEAARIAAVSAEESARIAADNALGVRIDNILSNTDPAALDSLSEVVTAFQNADGDLQTSITNLSTSASNDRTAIRSEFAAADDAIKGDLTDAVYSTIEDLDDALAQEVSDREAGDAALDARMVPMEEILEYQKVSVYENNAAVYADGAPGKEDAQKRDGWYYENDQVGGFNKINWYFHDGSQNQVSLGDFSAYAVMTFDDASESPILAVYTVKQNDSDDAVVTQDGTVWGRSAVVYSGFSTTPEVGKQYLVYFGQEPQIHPELPRLELSKSEISSRGPQQSDEVVLTSSFGTNSTAPVSAVKFLVEHLGVYSPSFKADVELKIRHASQVDLEAEEAARIAGDASLQSQIDALDTTVSQAVQFDKETITVTSQMITDGYVDLQAEAKANSMVMFVDRLGMHEGYDYSVSVVGGVTRITFLAPMLTPEPEALEAGQSLHVTYAK